MGEVNLGHDGKGVRKWANLREASASASSPSSFLPAVVSSEKRQGFGGKPGGGLGPWWGLIQVLQLPSS